MGSIKKKDLIIVLRSYEHTRYIRYLMLNIVQFGIA